MIRVKESLRKIAAITCSEWRFDNVTTQYTSWLVDLNVISPLTLCISPCEFLEPVDSIKRKRN